MTRLSLFLFFRDEVAILISLAIDQRLELLQADLSVASLVTLVDHGIDLIIVHVQSHSQKLFLHFLSGELAVTIHIERLEHQLELTGTIVLAALRRLFNLNGLTSFFIGWLLRHFNEFW